MTAASYDDGRRWQARQRRLRLDEGDSGLCRRQTTAHRTRTTASAYIVGRQRQRPKSTTTPSAAASVSSADRNNNQQTTGVRLSWKCRRHVATCRRRHNVSLQFWPNGSVSPTQNLRFRGSLCRLLPTFPRFSEVYNILRTFVPGPKHPLANKLFDIFGVTMASRL